MLLAALGVFTPRKQESLEDRVAAYSRTGNAGAATRGMSARPATSVAAPNMTSQAVGIAERALAGNKGFEARLGNKLEGAGMSVKPAEWLLGHAGFALGAALVGFLLSSGSVLFTLMLLAVGVVLPWIYLGMKKSRRLKAFNSQLPDTLQLMSGSLSAGLSLAQSVDTVVREGSEPMAAEFRRALVEARLGVQVEDALESVAERMQSEDFKWVVMAIRIQREVGGNLAELLNQVAETMREREYLRRQVKSLSAEGRLSAWILGGLPPVFLLYLVLLRPDYLDPMIDVPARLADVRRLRRDDGRRRLLDEQDGQGGGVVMGATLVLHGRDGRHLHRPVRQPRGDRRLHQRDPGREQVAGRGRGLHHAPRSRCRTSSSRRSTTGSSCRCSTGSWAWARSSPRPTTASGSGSKLDVAGNPPGLDRRPGDLAQVRRLRRRARPVAGGLPAAGRRVGPDHRGLRAGRPRSATSRRTCTSTRSATTAPPSCRRALPDALDLLTISVEAGLGFDAALSQVARNTEGPLAEEFARVLQEMQIGLGRSKALRALGERTSLPEIRGFVSAMVQADAFGIPIGQVLRVQASEIRVKRRQRAEEQAQKVPVKILLPLVFCILPCLFIDRPRPCRDQHHRRVLLGSHVA